MSVMAATPVRLLSNVQSTTSSHGKATTRSALTCRISSKSVSALALRKRVTYSRASLVVRASANKETNSFEADEIIKTLQEKWDETENKSQVFVYGGAAVVGLWLSSTIVGAINGIPLLPKLMELVGLGYTSWFVYRYLLFKSSRKDLIADVEELKQKIAGEKE
eukprot:CAMPEP_0114252802 /NCGR_PEP_ID=MMETSP0058-20121206/16042_1 /TAXON_ID=36894 /ORGANISM="Pyramimonas parkeae, CCMP726" /LENGTH=163 /DNA_ID=CAMNT_0001366783 /DNA_START=100 /DNA_END=591 /DNA_ORIENTATION=+